MSKKRLHFFELLTEVMSGMQIVVSPLLLSLLIAFVVHLGNPGTGGWIIAALIVLAGLTIGIIWAVNVAKKQGTVHFMSRVIATPELDYPMVDPASTPFLFLVRNTPSDGGALIEFKACEPAMDLLNRLSSMLEQTGFIPAATDPHPFVDELTMSLHSDRGTVQLHIDSWGLVFILSKQRDAIRFIAGILRASGDFRELPIDPTENH